MCHTTAGYLLYAALTHEYIFDHHPGDTFGCLADCGWITGHSYTVYGPLCNGATTVLFQGIPTFPNPGRYGPLTPIDWACAGLVTRGMLKAMQTKRGMLFVEGAMLQYRKLPVFTDTGNWCRSGKLRSCTHLRLPLGKQGREGYSTSTFRMPKLRRE